MQTTELQSPQRPYFHTLRVWVKEAGQKRGRVVFDFFLSHHPANAAFEPVRGSAAFHALTSEYPVGTLFKVKECKHEVSTEADLEAAFVDLVRSSWNNPAVVIAFKDAVAAAKGEA